MAVTAVAATGDVWVVPLLRELASDDALEVARASLVALESLSPGAAREVAELLAQDGRRAYSALGREALQRLQAAPGQSFLASSLAETLAQIAQLTDVAVLLRALDEPDVAIRIAAARRLSEVGDERAISSLLHHLKEAPGEVADAILEALGAIAPREAVAMAMIRFRMDLKTLHRLDPERASAVNRGQRAVKALDRGMLLDRILVLMDFLARSGQEGAASLLQFAVEEDDELPLPAVVKWRPEQALGSAKEWITKGKSLRLGFDLLGFLMSTPHNEHEETRAAALAHLQWQMENRPGTPGALALLTLNAYGWEPAWKTHAGQRLSDRDGQVRWAAVWVLGCQRQHRYMKRIEELLSDRLDLVRHAALCALAVLAPERRAEWSCSAFERAHADSIKLGCALWGEEVPPDEVAEAALQALNKPELEADGVVLFFWLLERYPTRWLRIIKAGFHAAEELVRERAKQELDARPDDVALPLYEQLLRSKDPTVRRTALRALAVRQLARRIELGLRFLQDDNAEVRWVAVAECIGCGDDPELVEPLLQAARDKDSQVRAIALPFLAKYDDRRVLPELISSLDDVDEEVREAAKELLDLSDLPVMKRLARNGVDAARWVETARAQIEAVNRWACDVGQELLGVPVRVCNYRAGLGRTRPSSRQRFVDIEVSDKAITTGHIHGDEIMRGLALHELGHHVCDFAVRGFRTTRGIARSEGFGDIYDILVDERLERILQARRPEWGIYFDRLEAYAWSQNCFAVPLDTYAEFFDRDPDAVRAAVARGELRGRLRRRSTGWEVLLRDRDMLSIPGAFPAFTAFMACLRCGFDPDLVPDERVSRALALVPNNLKDLPHGEVLAVARRIGAVLGGSDTFARHLKAWRQRMRAWVAGRKAFENWLRGLAENGALPAGIGGHFPGLLLGAAGIRLSKTPVRRVWRTLPPTASAGAGGQRLNLAPELEFPKLDQELRLPFDPAAHAAVVMRIRPHILRLREHLQRLGKREVDEFASRRGRRLDIVQARRVVSRPVTNLLVWSREEMHPNAYIGLLIDRSGSMAVADKMPRAIAFGVLLAESARDIPGLEGHVNAFDGVTFIRLGDFKRNAVAFLVASGGNNDSGALERAASLAS